jgi:hypothetical protein
VPHEPALVTNVQVRDTIVAFSLRQAELFQVIESLRLTAIGHRLPNKGHLTCMLQYVKTRVIDGLRHRVEEGQFVKLVIGG